MSDILLLGLSGLTIPYRDSFEMINAIEADKFHVHQYGDVGGSDEAKVRAKDLSIDSPMGG